jgi:ubiquinone/menaquinone biosynthesis C-methylase UbiE/uncharacterized protein YbaR (Trm112 family)
MHKRLIELLKCPSTGKKLYLKNNTAEEIIEKGWLVSEDESNRYVIRNSIPRFVENSNYADSFGLQWNRFSKTQLDSHSGKSISAERFWKSTGWNLSEMKNKWVLDVGCGSGRFAEIALSSGAQVVALDYSSAVDACWENLKHHPNLHVVQGDIYSLPFKPEFFDFIYCFGVLQHTPNVEKAFKCLPLVLAKKGHLCVDVYWKRIITMMHSKYLFRLFTTSISDKKLFSLLQKIVPTMLRMSIFLSKIPLVGVILKRLLPVANYNKIYELSEQQLQEWALLDTFDMLSPKYDNPQTKKKIFKYMKESGISNIEIFKSTLLVARGVKKY